MKDFKRIFVYLIVQLNNTKLHLNNGFIIKFSNKGYKPNILK